MHNLIAVSQKQIYKDYNRLVVCVLIYRCGIFIREGTI